VDAIQTHTNYRSFRDGYTLVICSLNAMLQPGHRGQLAPTCTI
jgi:hypothetical protein